MINFNLDCLTGDFLSNFIPCIFADVSLMDNIVQELLPPAQALGVDNHDISDTPQGVGRKLQSAHGDFSASARKYMLDLKLKEYGVSSNDIYNDVQKLIKTWDKGITMETITEHFKGFNFKQAFVELYLSKYDEHFQEIFKNVFYLRNYAHEFKALGQKIGRDSERVDGLLCEILNLLDPNLCDLVTCLEGYTSEQFEEGVDWLQCLVRCENVAPMAQCSADLFSTYSEPCKRIPWFSDILVGIMTTVFNKTSCLFEVQNPTEAIELVEGGPEQYVEFHMLAPPGILCAWDPTNMVLSIVGYVFGFDVNCDVEMQLTTQNWLNDLIPTGSRCRVPSRASRQVAIGFHEGTVNNSGVFKITESNWNSTFRIPLLPIVDHRVDGNATVEFTMKLNVQGNRRGKSVKMEVSVQDTDPQTDLPVECYSLNDPHIMTFDRHSYSTHYHGAFYLYKHTSLPYEVQVIYQPCEPGNQNATCNCAVAVRSGDDVFVMDRCRRKNDNDVTQSVILYNNGELTPGTRVFKMNGGLRHDVVLPHGTIVRVVTNKDLLNVWVIPGSYDRDSTEGLCGIFNEDPTDETNLPDGETWRVPDEELIFEGATAFNESFSPLSACHCKYIIMSGAQCECGRGSVTEICDLYLEDEYGENITALFHSSLNTGSPSTFLEDLDLDENYIPSTSTDWAGSWTEPDARLFCEELISNSSNPIIQLCTGPTFYSEAVDFCMEDIRIVDNTDWKEAAIANAMFGCYNKLVRDTTTPAGSLTLFPNSSCIDDCNEQGQCVHGVCLCDEGFWGPVCLHTIDDVPGYAPQETQICDNRNQICNFATVWGNNLAENVDMRCKIKNVEISSDGVDYLSRRKTSVWEHRMTVISMNQAACPLPSNGSFEVTVAWRGHPLDSEPAYALNDNSILGRLTRLKRALEVTLMETEEKVTFIYIAHDSMCYECSHQGQSCTRKTSNDHCWIDDECYAPEAQKVDDACRYCAPWDNTDDWTLFDTETCEEQKAAEDKEREEDRKNKILRGALGASISVLVVIVIIIIFCVTGNKEKKAKMLEDEMLRNSTVVPQSGTVYYKDSPSPGYTNMAMTEDENDPDNYDVIRNSALGSSRSKSVSRVEVLKSEDFGYSTVVNGSIRSTGSGKSDQGSMKTSF